MAERRIQPVFAPSRRPVLCLFAMSGASGLVYEVIWARQLGLIFGNTTSSVTVVLSAFMAGLALGAVVAGRWLVRRSKPMKLYAVLEGLIGIYALLFPALVHGVELTYPALFSEETPLAIITTFRACAAFALVLVPTTMMGATLPLTTEYVHSVQREHQDWNAGRLYAANTFGAALGSFISGFVLIEVVGIWRTTLIAAFLNLLVAGIGLWLSRRVPSDRTKEVTEIDPVSIRGHRGLLLLFAASGGLALAGEVVWTRVLSLLLGSSTYAFSAILIAYLVGIALGSWCLAGYVLQTPSPKRLLPMFVLGVGAWHYVAVWCVPLLYDFADFLMLETHAPFGAAWASLLFVTCVVSLMLPPAFLSGALFPTVTRIIGQREGDRGQPIARAYAWNTVGAIFGSLVGGFVLSTFFEHFHAIYVLALLYVGLAAAALLWLKPKRLVRLSVVSSLLMVALTGLTIWSITTPDLFFDLLRRRKPDYSVTFHQSGHQGITTVIEREGPQGSQERFQVLLVNGIGMTIKVFSTKAMAHLPLMAHGNAEETLVICLGMGTTFRSALAYGGRVDVVELVPQVIDAYDRFYPDRDRVMDNPRARVLVNDGRNYLLTTDKKYDVITIDPPPPIDNAGVNNLYSREFLQLVRDHLQPGGIAAHWIPQVTPLSGVPDDETQKMLVATFLDVFPHVRCVTTGGARVADGLHLLGSNDPIRFDPNQIEQALQRSDVRKDFYEFTADGPAANDPVREHPELRDECRNSSILTDDRPSLEFHLLRAIAAGEGHTLLRLSP
jgi:spermidine synthase